MTIDISKIRPGDRVTLVPLEVSVSNPMAIMVTLPRGGGYSINPDQIAAHHPAPREFQVGDRVKWGTHRGVVEHLARGRARVLWSVGDDSLVAVANLTLVEDGE